MRAYLDALVEYALSHGLIQPGDEIWAMNRLLEVMELDDPGQGEAV